MSLNPVAAQESFSAPAQARIYVIDDHAEVRKSLHVLLGTVNITTWPFASALDFLDQLDTLRPAPILLDIRMPGLDGIELMTTLAKRDCTWPVIVMTAHGDVPTAVKMMKLGAMEFLEKPFDLDAAIIALERAYQLVESVAAAETAATDARARFAVLSKREAQVVAGILTGEPNKIQAANLGLSIRTIEMHRANALHKLRISSVAQAVALAQLASWLGSA